MKKLYSFGILFLLVYLSSCSNLSKQKNLWQDSLSNGTMNIEQVNASMKDLPSKDVLWGLERASRTAFVLGDSNVTLNNTQKAISIYSHIENNNYKDFLGNALASTVSSDTSLYYQGSDFERALVYFYQSLSYLSLGDLEGAMVDVRNANITQQMALNRRSSKVDKEEQKLAKKQVKSTDNSFQNQQELDSLKSKFLNPYIYYVTGNIMELSGEKNNALVAYKQALEISNNPYLIQDALRLSQIYDTNYYQLLTSKYPKIQFLSDETYSDYKNLLIVYEQGFLPPKYQFQTSMFFNAKVYNVVLPRYLNDHLKANNLSVSLMNKNINKGEYKFGTIVDLYNMAQNDLSEQYTAIAARQVARLATREGSYYLLHNIGLNDDVADLLTLGLSSGLSVLDKADLRSFDTLPNLVQVVKISTKNDFDNLNLNISGRHVVIPASKNENSKLQLLYIVDTGNKIYYKFIN